MLCKFYLVVDFALCMREAKPSAATVLHAHQVVKAFECF